MRCDIENANKKSFSAKLILVLTFTLLLPAIKAQPVKQHGQLKVVGTQLMDAHNQPVVLHGMSLGWHNLWPRFYNKGVVHTLAKNWNCTVVRAAMGIELNDSGYLKSPADSKAKIKAVVDAAIKEGIYVIIDWHCHNIQLDAAKQFFREMATAYGKHPNIIYELFNEPDYETWPEVKAYSTTLIQIIRSIDTSNIILVGCPRWDQDIQLPAADPIKGYRNIMYTMHFYAGTHKQWLRDKTDAALKAGLPVFVSECAGMEASGDGAIDTTEWDKFVQWMDDRKLSWIAWSVSDKKETCSVLLPTAASDGKWNETDIKEWGILARKALKKY
ncbi:MAG: glycoside hydrolase family 5 protein [Bacteroidetes bacterium]|nr:glycoside hydrolase family 5 protein [Bacteroidota bacterium]